MERNERTYEQIVSTQQVMLAQLSGLQRVLAMPLSDESKAAVQAQIGRHRQRLALLDMVVAAYDALEHDGYPELPIAAAPGVSQELAEAVTAQQGQLRQALSQVSDELGQVQTLFALSRRRASTPEPKDTSRESSVQRSHDA